MLQPDGYYEIESTGLPSLVNPESTPFSVKDILNLVDQHGENYINTQMDR